MGPDWEDPAAGRRETGQTVGPRLEYTVAETVGALGAGLAVAPETVGACGAADRVDLPGCEEQNLAEGGVAPGTVSVHQVVQAGAERRAVVADLGEDPGQAGHNTAPDPESHNLLVPAVHKIPSKQNTKPYYDLKTIVENTDAD